MNERSRPMTAKDHPSTCDCFSCKLAYWRENGAPGWTYAGGHEGWFNNPSRFQQERDEVAAAKAAGRNIERKR